MLLIDKITCKSTRSRLKPSLQLFEQSDFWQELLLDLVRDSCHSHQTLAHLNWSRWATMATIKAIEARSVHQIQSGQVIVDLCSVVKELVENSLDAKATAIEVRFKNNGLDSIEVQDNGDGISPENYESLALKHYTSKLATYDDLSSLQTFGFRGEALSSLCALSKFHVLTARANEAPKGKRLDFELSGRLKGTSVVACPKGTIAVVEDLFAQLPVRQKELAKNIKREYGKVLGLLHAYACISTGVRFSVRNAMPKGHSSTVFATNSNTTTKENIANLYGAKTLSALVPLALELEFQPSSTQRKLNPDAANRFAVCGHISRPVYGEGRQTPDRQMFFVNGRPCGLPQIAKAINEVYKSFNVSQSPFISADFRMDTDSYDVNVSPDKRTILLHDAAILIENLKTGLTELFDRQEQTVPQSQLQTSKLPKYKKLTVQRDGSRDSTDSVSSKDDATSPQPPVAAEVPSKDFSADESEPNSLLRNFFRNQASTREGEESNSGRSNSAKWEKAKEKMAERIAETLKAAEGIDEYDDVHEVIQSLPGTEDSVLEPETENAHVRDFNERMAEQQLRRSPNDEPLGRTEEGDAHQLEEETSIPAVVSMQHDEYPNVIQNAFDKMRPKRPPVEVATITIGDKTTTALVGSQRPNKINVDSGDAPSQRRKRLKTTPKLSPLVQHFSQSLRQFAAPETQASEDPGIDRVEGCGSQDEDRIDADLEISEPESEDRGERAGRERTRSRNDESDEDYVDEEEKKAEEETRVTKLIQAAEESAARVSNDAAKRANKVLKNASSKDSTTSLRLRVEVPVQQLLQQINHFHPEATINSNVEPTVKEDQDATDTTAEQRLSLTVSKGDFAGMHIVGQFNLGFILAVRERSNDEDHPGAPQSDELFIIDQHASDEKFNFERLQAETVVSNQRLVRPLLLDLTAVEEEIVLENDIALQKNGFLVQVDSSGDQRTGQRCKLISLPVSKEVVFNTRDLEELIHLLSEAPIASSDSVVPRPGKIRKMFAMRACRSSIMIGKTLTRKQMSNVLTHMGTIDKPWNCPHGRPTMRHLMSLNAFDTWDEMGEPRESLAGRHEADIWQRYTS